MREIPLSKGQIAIVDDDDYEYLSQFSWHCNDSHGTGRNYAYRREYTNGKPGKLIAMHREIMGCVHGDGIEVDHIEPLLTLDNRRSNLRKATSAQNKWNQRRCVTNKSGFKWVSYNKQNRNWMASFSHGNRMKYVGSFSSPELAHQAAYEKIKEIRGEFARTE